jgi:long-subunit fatty acid transport protein
MISKLIIRDKVLVRILLYAFFTEQVTAQSPDIFRLEYMLMPKNKADAELSRIKLVANVPLKVKESDNIILGAEYNYLSQEFGDNSSFGMQGIKNLHVVDLNLAYVYKYNEDWRFIGVATPRLSSTLTNNLVQGDVSINVTVGAFKDKQNIDKPMRLVLGIAYNSTVALRIPLPIVYYEKKFHPKWTYVVGVPKTGFKYHLKKNKMIQTEIILDGYFVNLQNNIILPNMGFASSISSSAALITIGYQHNITKNMSFYGYAGHTLFQDGVLRDKDRNDIFTLNDEPSLYFRTGFRIGI